MENCVVEKIRVLSHQSDETQRFTLQRIDQKISLKGLRRSKIPAESVTGNIPGIAFFIMWMINQSIPRSLFYCRLKRPGCSAKECPALCL